MRVGLLRDMTVKRVMVMSTKGSCTVLADGERRGELTSSDGLRVEFVPGGGIVAKSLSLDIKGAQRIDLVPVRVDGGFRMRPLDHKLAERSYPGTLTVTSSKNALQIGTRHLRCELFTPAGRGERPAQQRHPCHALRSRSRVQRTGAIPGPPVDRCDAHLLHRAHRSGPGRLGVGITRHRQCGVDGPARRSPRPALINAAPRGTACAAATSPTPGTRSTRTRRAHAPPPGTDGSGKRHRPADRC